MHGANTKIIIHYFLGYMFRFLQNHLRASVNHRKVHSVCTYSYSLRDDLNGRINISRYTFDVNLSLAHAFNLSLESLIDKHKKHDTIFSVLCLVSRAYLVCSFDKPATC